MVLPPTSCIYKAAGEKVRLNAGMILLACIDLISIMLCSYGYITGYSKLFLFISILIYIKWKVAKDWAKAIRLYGTMLIIIMTSQIILFYLVKLLFPKVLATNYKGIVINFAICVLIFLWKKKYGTAITSFLSSTKGIVILVLYAITLIRIIQLNDMNGAVDFELSIQFLIETIGLSIASVLWLNAEASSQKKAKEIYMYEMYNKAFEQTIETIRSRQHEFENHINAIRCLHYTSNSIEELIKQQSEYCDNLVKENELNKLLKCDLEPVLVGFLYSKITDAKERNTDVKYNIQPINIRNNIEIYELVELIGILFDNALEAVENSEKKIILNLEKINDNVFKIEIANRSRGYSNSELEKFCEYGYSTKDKKRGIGLARAKEIVQRHNAEILITNITICNENYLSFSVEFGN